MGEVQECEPEREGTEVPVYYARVAGAVPYPSRNGTGHFQAIYPAK
jgi:hypothetical protein